MTNILILYYSRTGNIEKMAQQISNGVEKVPGAEAILRTVPGVSSNIASTKNPVPDSGAPYASTTDLERADGIIIGSPTRFGNMAAAMKYFIDGTSAQWQSGALIDKPISCFTSTGSIHGGQETTLLTMMLPFIHHGAIILGVPYSETALFSTTTGGTPYGASHLAGGDSKLPLSPEEIQICISQGKRMAEFATRLKIN